MEIQKQQIVWIFFTTMLLILSFGCNETPEVSITFSPNEISGITEATAICEGIISRERVAKILSHGICWDTIPNPTIKSQKIIHFIRTQHFIYTLTNLIPGKKYYVREYATYKAGIFLGDATIYGPEISFITKHISILTEDPTDILTHSVKIGGNIITDGTGESILSRGICYSNLPIPTILNDTIAVGSGKGSYSAKIINLKKSSTYYVRAYASCNTGTYYGDIKKFVTKGDIAEVATNNVINITNTSATLSGEVTKDNGYPILARGFVWSTNQNPTIDLNTNVMVGSGVGKFTSTINELVAGTIYYVKAYATNSEGTAYGDQTIFSTTGMIDIDGNVYNTIKIGSQIWTVENMKTTRYNNGDVIKTTYPADINIKYEDSPKYQWAPYGDENNVSIYGRLYTWDVINDIRGICPKGWHVATHDEWMKLKDYVANNLGYSTSVGKALASKEYWIECLSPDVIGNDLTKNNSSGFTAIPSGMRNFEFGFNYSPTNSPNNQCYFWSSSGSIQSLNACTSTPGLYGMTHTSNGLSVRCVKD